MFLDRDDTECAWQSRPCQGPPGEAKNRKGKRKTQRCVQRKRKKKNKHKILKCGHRRTLPGGPKDAKARKDCQKTMSPYQPDKGAGKDFSQNNGKNKFQKRKGKEEAHPQSGTLSESCLPSDTRWIEISSEKISETSLVLMYNDRILPLQQILCIHNLTNRNLFGKLHNSLSNNATLFNHG